MTEEPQKETPRDKQRRLSSGARYHAVQALFQMEVAGDDVEATQRNHLAWRFGRLNELADEIAPEADEALFETIVDNAVTWQARIDQLTDKALVEKWPLGRIDSVLRAIFRAAGAELIGQKKTPPKVIITEYLRLAQAFFDEGAEGKLTNAVLDHMARAVRPDEF